MLRAHAAGEGVRQPERRRERQDRQVSAPPIPAEKVAIVARSRFTHGSRFVIIRHAVSA